MKELGFITGTADACLFYHPAWDMSLAIHGDDIVATGNMKDLDSLEKGIKRIYEVKTQTLGGSPEGKEIRLLNRTLRLEKEGIDIFLASC